MIIKQILFEILILLFVSLVADFVFLKFLNYPIFVFTQWTAQILIFSLFFSFGYVIVNNFNPLIFFIFNAIFSLIIPFLFSHTLVFFIGINFIQTLLLSLLIFNIIGAFYYFFWIKLDPNYMKILSATLISALFYSLIMRILIGKFDVFQISELDFYKIFFKGITIFLISYFGIFIAEIIISIIFEKKISDFEVDIDL
jgi:hypothetical protein